MLDKETKNNLIKSYQVHGKDTGSSKVQIAVLTEKIKKLTEHFKTHSKDHHSRRGLLVMVGKRRRHLDYLKKVDYQGYQDLISKLEIRK